MIGSPSSIAMLLHSRLLSRGAKTPPCGTARKLRSGTGETASIGFTAAFGMVTVRGLALERVVVVSISMNESIVCATDDWEASDRWVSARGGQR